MGTRGALVFRVGNADKIVYNHFDSYPSCLGRDVATFVAAMVAGGPEREEGTKAAVRELRNVKEDDTPTADDVAEIERRWASIGDGKPLHGNVSVGTDWYAHLRGAQGKPAAYLALGVYTESGPAWLADSLFCEWAYVINLDTRELEVYRGFQRTPHDRGRYADLPDSERRVAAGATREYWPVALVATVAFDDPDLVKKVAGVEGGG